MPDQTDLRIRLDGSRGTGGYAPGDTIRGTISLEAGAEAGPDNPGAQVTLTLSGRTRCTITKHGNSPKRASAGTHNSTFNFFDPDATTEVLLDGPLGVSSLPFAITIPREADGAVLAANPDRETSYTPIDGTDHPLPGSFAFTNSDSSKSLSADVTYTLHASLTPHTTPTASKSATLPIFIHPPTPTPLVDDFQLRTRRHDDAHTFHSYLLPAGHADPPGKLRRLFRHGSVPHLGVKYEVDAPSVIQLDNPAPLPLRMRAIPDSSRTSEDVDGVKQNITVNEVYLSIDADTNCRAGEDKSAKGSGRLDYRREKLAGVSLQLAFGDPTLDLGRRMCLRFYSGMGGVAPAFTALNISHENHRLSWVISVSFEGEEHRVRGSQPVTVLPPPWSGPPSPRRPVVRRQETLPPPYELIDQPPEYSLVVE